VIGLLCLAALAAIIATVAAIVAPVAPRPATGARCPWLNSSLSPDQRAHELLAAMTIDDRIAMVHQPDRTFIHSRAGGYIPPNPRLCTPDLVLNDAGAGVADRQVKTVAFPAPIAQAATWDRRLEREFGRALGSEAWHKGVNVQLAPDVNIARVPMNGRNSEAFGEDPFLAGQTAVAEIDGIQQNPVIATVKHYALNNSEHNRATVSADAGERTIREIYLPTFEAAVGQAHVGSVMCAYNRINGVYACQDGWMLNGILKGELGFSGFVMSDWGATHSTVPSALAGLDMEMNAPRGTYFGAALKAAVRSGKVPVARLDDMVLRILRSMFRAGIFEHPHAPEPGASAANVQTPADTALAQKISEEGTVLLKNAGGVLPVGGAGKRLAVIGSAGGRVGTQMSYGTGGSSHVPEYGAKADVVSPLQGIRARGAANGDLVRYADGSSIGAAVAAASTADVAVVFASDAESEGSDRPSLSLADARDCPLTGCVPLAVNQDRLIEAVARANPHTLVVLDTGGPMLMPWLGRVKGVLQAWYPGQQDGNAIAALLFGDANPSGKLPETFPAAMADLPTGTPQQYPGTPDSAGVPHERYSEGLLVGYRWYDARRITPLFPFGFGLSYTTFALRSPRVRRAPRAGASVELEVVNTGRRAGAEVPQVYVGLPTQMGEPPKRLAGFDRVLLAPGASQRVTIGLDPRAFSYWSSRTRSWMQAPGCDSVMIGTSSRDIKYRRIVAVGDVRCRGAVARIGL
jgi:beta-glucosidase